MAPRQPNRPDRSYDPGDHATDTPAAGHPAAYGTPVAEGGPLGAWPGDTAFPPAAPAATDHPDTPEAPPFAAYDGGLDGSRVAPPVTGDPGGADGAIRAAERFAERAAAVAATEDFHPLRLRPYVVEPGGDTGDTAETAASTVRHLIGAAEAEAAEGAGPAAADLGLFPAGRAGSAPAANATDATGTGDPVTYAAVARGRHRRRKRGIVVAAAAVAASALAAGAVAVTGQVIGQEQGGTDRALPDQTASMPDVVLPPDATEATATAPAAAPQAGQDAAGRSADPWDPSPSASAPDPTSASASASAAGASPQAASDASTPSDPTTAGSSSAAASPSAASAASTASDTPAPAATSPTAAAASAAPTAAGSATPSADGTTPTDTQVLQLGDTGQAVADLQRRLQDVWVYYGPVDGVFDQQVQAAVATFQVWSWVSDAPDGSHDGVYGPNTRTALESETQDAD